MYIKNNRRIINGKPYSHIVRKHGLNEGKNRMAWLWIDCPLFTVRVECDGDNNIKSLPPILIKRYKPFFGMPYQRFVHQILHDYQRMEYLTIREYEDDGNVFLRGWKGESNG